MTQPAYPRIEKMSVEELATQCRLPGNPRIITEEGKKQLDDQLEELGNLQPITFNRRTGHILGGNQRIERYHARGDTETDVWVVDLSDEKERAAALALNNHAGDFDIELLKRMTEELGKDFADATKALALAGFKPGELDAILAAANAGNGGGEGGKQQAFKTLQERFLLPPFTILDARQGYWQTRKAAWIALGLRGEIGRGGNLLKMSDTVLSGGKKKKISAKEAVADQNEWSGTSIFDPVLCEAMYHWYCTVGGSVLDPFSGGVTRGAVAGLTGHPYTGIELSKAQIKANESLWPTIKAPHAASTSAGKKTPKPKWICGDSRDVQKLAKGEYDMIFSCPPYADLERYSDDPRDLSTMPYDKFLSAYREIIKRSCAMLRANRFAVFVVGDVRSKVGFYRGFVPDTIRAFEDAGLRYYNEAILVTAVGSLPIRAAKIFQAARKLGKTHQNVLVFYKGDPTQIHAEFGDCQIAEIEEPQTDGSENQEPSTTAESLPDGLIEQIK